MYIVIMKQVDGRCNAVLYRIASSQACQWCGWRRGNDRQAAITSRYEVKGYNSNDIDVLKGLMAYDMCSRASARRVCPSGCQTAGLDALAGADVVA
jgi:hypothetical protein